MGERDDKTQIVQMAVEGDGGKVKVDARYREEAQFFEATRTAGREARRKEATTRPADLAAARQRAESAATVPEGERVIFDNIKKGGEKVRVGEGPRLSKKIELLRFLEKNKTLKAIVRDKSGTSHESQQKFIEKVRIAAAQKAAGRELDVGTLNILNFLQEVYNKSNGVDFSVRAGSPDQSQQVGQTPSEAAVANLIFSRPLLSKIERAKARWLTVKI